MGLFITLASIAAYITCGMLTVPLIVRRRYKKHGEGLVCLFSDGCYVHGSDAKFRQCSIRWAAIAWLWWPIYPVVELPASLAEGTLRKDAEEAERVKQMEKDNAAAIERYRREEAVRRANDPDTMTLSDFDRHMLAVPPAPAQKRKRLSLTTPWS